MDGEDIYRLRQQIRDTAARMYESRKTSRQIATHLDDLQSTLALLQSEQLTATTDAADKRKAAEMAQAKVGNYRIRLRFAMCSSGCSTMGHGC